MDKFLNAIKEPAFWCATITYVVAISPHIGLNFTEEDGALFTSFVDMVLMTSGTAITLWRGVFSRFFGDGK